MGEFVSFIGLSAGVVAILGYLPQIHKSFSLKKMSEVSVWLMILFMTSSLLWTVYGLYKEDIILAGLSAITFILATILIIMKIFYEKGSQYNSFIRQLLPLEYRKTKS